MSTTNENEFDLEALKAHIASLEAVASRTLQQNEELADCYVQWALELFDEGEDLEMILEVYGKAENVLKLALSQVEETELRRRLGIVYLQEAATCNDYDELEQAIELYGQSIDTIKPLEDTGDGEAKYDIAGARLNRGTIYHEIGEYESAKADFDDSFLAFRAVEKISDLDTRYYMAKVSVAQGSLFRDMDEPLDKIVDAYNRAMRLFVELIDMGQMELERDLANTLMDRCTATYEDYLDREFESETDRLNKFGDILVDVQRAIEILEKKFAEDPDVRVDLFSAIVTEGSMLLDIDKFAEAIPIFTRAIDEFAELGGDEDPVVLNSYAAAVENRGMAYSHSGHLDKAMDDFNRAIDLRQRIQDPEFDLDEDERAYFLPTLANNYNNRASTYFLLGNKDQARKDCQHGLDLIRSLTNMKEELQEVENLFVDMLEKWK